MPWTRLVVQGKTTNRDQTIDLPEFILQNRETLVLKPNDDYSDQHTFFGWEMNESGWERALKQAMRFPLRGAGARNPCARGVPVSPTGATWSSARCRWTCIRTPTSARVQGCSSWVSAGGSGFSSAAGLTPTFILEPSK